MEDTKKQELPPAVPEKEPIQTSEKEVEDKTVTASSTRTVEEQLVEHIQPVEPVEPVEPVQAEVQPQPQLIDFGSESTTPPKIDDDMAPENGPGKIPLENMRSKSSYSEAAGGSSEKKSKLTKPRPETSGKEPVVDSEGDRNMDLDLEASDAAMLGLSSMEMFDAVSYQKTPTRKSSLPPTVEEDEPAGDARSSSSKPSRSRSQDNYDKNSYARRKENDAKDAEESLRLRRLVQELMKKNQNITLEKQIAEEKAERAHERIAEMKHHLNSDMSEIELNTEALAQERDKFRDENRALREQLSDAQSHIFSLQPYRKDLTPEEVGREYDGLVEQVQDWVEKFMQPYLDDHEEGIETVLAIARKRTTDANKFKRVLHQYPDLVHGSMFPETDEDIVTSLIMRYMYDNIFQSIIYGSIQHYVEVISFLENNMQMSVEPKRDLFSVRSWTAEAYSALLSSPNFRTVRERRRKEMTVELGQILKVFCKKQDKVQAMYEGLDDNCIWPAMKLYEKLQVSTHHFYLDINPYIVWGPGGDLNTSPEFIDTLKKLNCKNVLQNRKVFDVARMDPEPSKKELYHHLLNVCTVVPALNMRQIGQKDSIKEPIVVRKQQMLVAYGEEEKRRKFVENGDRPIISHLYHSKSDRSGESWMPIRWPG